MQVLELGAMASSVVIIVKLPLTSQKKKQQILCFRNSDEHLHIYSIKITVPALI